MTCNGLSDASEVVINGKPHQTLDKSCDKSRSNRKLGQNQKCFKLGKCIADLF